MNRDVLLTPDAVAKALGTTRRNGLDMIACGRLWGVRWPPDVACGW